MPAQVFGAPAIAVELYMAFYGAAPSNPLYQNYVALAAQDPRGFANLIGSQFVTTSDTDLATIVLRNLGITATTIPAASYNALQPALAQYFAAYGVGQRGFIVLQLMDILSRLETDVTFGTVAQTFNQSVANSYIYASNTANTQTQTLGTITTTQPLTVNAGDIVNGTTGNDNINGNLFFNTPSGTFFQTLNTGDTVVGGTGTDNLNVGFNNLVGGVGAQTINATLTSIEGLSVNATGNAATTLDMTNGTGLTTVSITNGTAGGDITLSNLATLLTSVSLSSTAAGLSVGSTAAAVAGTADAVAVNLSQAGSAAAPVTLSMTGYETFNIASNGPATNGVTLGYSAGATATLTGTTSLALSTGTSTNAITVNGSGMTGTAALTVTASGGSNVVNVTGTANGDAVNFAVSVAAGVTAIADANTTSSTYGATDVYNGGAGTDTIALGAANVVGVTTNQTNLSNLEVVSLTDAVDAGIYTPALFGGATSLTLAYNPAILAGTNAAAVSGAVTSGTGTASTVAYQVNYGAGTSGLTLLGNNTGGATLFSSGSATNDVLNLTIGSGASTGLVEGIFATTGFETVNLASNGALGVTNAIGAITMTATAATELLSVSGARNITINGSVTADQVNASALTGSLNMTAVSFGAGLSLGAPVTNAGMQITGGSAADTLFGSDGADQIVGGAGNDRIMFGTAASQGDIVTGGDGADTFRFTAATQSAGTAQIVKITDFVAGTDKIGLFAVGGITAISTVVTGSLATADTLTQVYAGAGTGTAGGATTPIAKVLTVSAGLAAGTYLIIDNNNNGSFTDTTDMMINITGVTGTVATTDFSFT
jgi:hypothetical protein